MNKNKVKKQKIRKPKKVEYDEDYWAEREEQEFKEAVNSYFENYQPY